MWLAGGGPPLRRTSLGGNGLATGGPLLPSILPVSAALELPAWKRPSLRSIAEGYRRRLEEEGTEARLLDDAHVEFTTSMRLEVHPRWPTLKVVPSGLISIEPTDAGFRVQVQARPRLWLLLASWVLVDSVVVDLAPRFWMLGVGLLVGAVLAWAVVRLNISVLLADTNRRILELNERAARDAEGF